MGGLYDVAADAPHTQPVFWLMTTVRERSIAVRAAGVTVPGDLADPKRLASGAGQYAAMCSSCHLAPGMKRTKISLGSLCEARRNSAVEVAYAGRGVLGCETRAQDVGHAGLGSDARR